MAVDYCFLLPIQLMFAGPRRGLRGGTHRQTVVTAWGGGRKFEGCRPTAPERYFTNSSARASSDCGTVRPSAFAVFRLATSSNLSAAAPEVGRLGGVEDFSGVN